MSHVNYWQWGKIISGEPTLFSMHKDRALDKILNPRGLFFLRRGIASQYLEVISQIMTNKWFWHLRIFRPSYGPVSCSSERLNGGCLKQVSFISAVTNNPNQKSNIPISIDISIKTHLCVLSSL